MPSFRDRYLAAVKAFRNPRAGAPSAERDLKQISASTGTASKSGQLYAARPLAGGRQTQPGNYNPFGLTAWYWIPKRQWQLIDPTELDVTMFTAEEMLALLPDLSPEFSKAVWNYLRIAGTKVKFQGLTVDGDENEAVDAAVQDILEGVNAQWGGWKAVVQQMELTAYLHGAACCDVAPTKDLKDLQDIFPINPDSIYFQRDEHQILVPFQRQMIWGQDHPTPFRQLNEELFFYNPVDPFPDDPYGRPPVAPAIQTSLALALVMRDLAHVIHNQGWPKIDIALIGERLKAIIPESIAMDPQKFSDFTQSQLDAVASAYNSMAPEDAYIHPDYTEVKDTVSAGTKLFPVEEVVRVFRKQLIESLKSLSIFHNEHEGSTETYGTVEWDIYTMTVDDLRNVAIAPFVRALTVALNLRGIQGTVRHEWEPIKATSSLDAEMAVAQKIANHVDMRDQGWETQDDASNAITGSDAVADPPDPMAAVMGPVTPFKQGPKTFPPPKSSDAVGKVGDAIKQQGGKPKDDSKSKTQKDRSLEYMTAAKGVTMAMVRAYCEDFLRKELQKAA